MGRPDSSGPRRAIAVLATGLLLGLGSCAGAEARIPDEAAARRTILAVMDSIAGAISARDADAIAARVPRDSSVVYVTDGQGFRGYELRDTLRNYYATLRSLSFTWDSVRLAPIGSHTWVATAWSRATAADAEGHHRSSHATSTWTFGWTGAGWSLGSATKITLP
jgi:hypothetical protein